MPSARREINPGRLDGSGRRCEHPAAMTRTLIKNGTILTVDPKLGDLDRGDVLIEDDRIVEVGRNLAAAGAAEIDASRMIVMPGLVNTHIHTWETGLRGIGADWVSHRDYHGNMHGNLATRFGAADNYVANLVGALGQLDGGTTTILDWCHNITSPDMADAALDGLAESGIRAVFGHGTAKPPAKAGDKPYYELPFPREPLARLRKGRLASDDSLITLAMAILGPDYTSYEIAAEDMRLAREFGVIASAHTWGRPSRKTPDGMLRLARAGLLGPDHNIVHGNAIPDEELKICADAGCTVSATPLAEMMNSPQGALLGRYEKYGGLTSIGTDVDVYFSSSMLAVTRHAFMHQRALDNRELQDIGHWPPQRHKTNTRRALEWATIGGAKVLRLDHRIGSLTPGKQADVVMIRTDDLNTFPTVPGGDPVHAVVMYAENANVDTVLVAGKAVKRGGKLVYPADRLAAKKEALAASRERIMQAGNYIYRVA
jgi:cytosine/adenosine deaminase-related metal-dependent hydrolase